MVQLTINESVFAKLQARRAKASKSLLRKVTWHEFFLGALEAISSSAILAISNTELKNENARMKSKIKELENAK